MQTSDLAITAAAFGNDFLVSKADGDVVMATPKKHNPTLLIHHSSEWPLLVMFRIFGAASEGEPWSLGLWIDGYLRSSILFEKNDSALLVSTISNAVSPNIISFVADNKAPTYFNITHASIIQVTRPSMA